MREPLEIVTASLLQNMVQTRKKKHLFRDQITFLKSWKSYFGALGAESPLRWGHMMKTYRGIFLPKRSNRGTEQIR